MSDKHFVGLDLTGVRNNGEQRPVSRVTLLVDDENAVTAGDDTGIELTASCPYATQTMADSLLAGVKGYRYRMFAADDARLDPASELGDGVTAGGIYSVLSRISEDGSGFPSITAPGEEELEDEFPAGGLMSQEFNRKIAQIRSQILKTAESITLRVENEITGLRGELTLTASSLTAKIEETETGLNAKLELTAQNFQVQINGLNNSYSSISQTVDSISLGVFNGQESSTIVMYKNGIAVSSQNISFSGMVTFSDLSGNAGTVINGGAINTSTLYLDSLYGNIIYLRDARGNIGAQFNISNASSASSRVEMWGNAIYLGTGSGHIYLQTDHSTLGLGDEISAGADLIPSRANMYRCGSYGFPWADVYSQDGTISASDRTGKKDIDYDMGKYSGLFDRLRPCSFLRKNGISGRRHHGFIAQEVLEALKAEGLTGKDFAGYVEWEDGEECGCGLRYGEIIAMLVHEVQELKRRFAA